MIRRPPRSTRTYTLFPYATLFRAVQECRETGMRRDDQVDVKSPDRIGQRADRHNPIPRLSACCKSHVVPNLKTKGRCTKALHRLSPAASRSRLLVAEAGRHVYTPRLLMRGGAVWQLVGFLTRRSQVQIPPQPNEFN